MIWVHASFSPLANRLLSLEFPHTADGKNRDSVYLMRKILLILNRILSRSNRDSRWGEIIRQHSFPLHCTFTSRIINIRTQQNVVATVLGPACLCFKTHCCSLQCVEHWKRRSLFWQQVDCEWLERNPIEILQYSTRSTQFKKYQSSLQGYFIFCSGHSRIPPSA